MSDEVRDLGGGLLLTAGEREIRVRLPTTLLAKMSAEQLEAGVLATLAQIDATVRPTATFDAWRDFDGAQVFRWRLSR